MFFVKGCVPSNSQSNLMATLAPQEAYSGSGGCFPVTGWAERVKHADGMEGYVPVPYHEDLLSKMVQSHTAGDFCLIGGRVSEEYGGKRS